MPLKIGLKKIEGLNTKTIIQGADLPDLNNPASTNEVFEGKEVINRAGNKITGTFTIDNEITSQENLLTQLKFILENKATGSSGDKTSFTYTWHGTEYKFYFLPGQTWEEWFNDTVHANKDYALGHFYGVVSITASQEDGDYGNEVADILLYPDTGDVVYSEDLIQPINYEVSYWNY